MTQVRVTMEIGIMELGWRSWLLIVVSLIVSSTSEEMIGSGKSSCLSNERRILFESDRRINGGLKSYLADARARLPCTILCFRNAVHKLK